MSVRRALRPNLNSTNMNFRPSGPDIKRSEFKGTRPTAPPTGIQEILVMMIMHVCRKSIFFDTNIKVGLYLAGLFVISLIGDFMPLPKTYLARSDNVFNVYFVKIGWGWTLLFTIPFLVMTSYTLCCGDMKKLLRHHVPRIIIATFFWFFWTKLFNIIETSYGRCTIKNYHKKSSCLKAGHFWNGFDISGHAFILIHSSLVLIEEARPIIKWESIKEYLRNELYDRSQSESSSTNPLRNLSEDQIRKLKYLYDRFTPIIRTLFISMTTLQLLWDTMLVGTMLYYHRMAEKFVSGVIAILTWYFTYRFWYPSQFLPDPAGSGLFCYQRDNRDIFTHRKSGGSGINLSSSGTTPARTNTQTSSLRPTFMGMPLYTNTKSSTSNATAGPTTSVNTAQIVNQSNGT